MGKTFSCSAKNLDKTDSEAHKRSPVSWPIDGATSGPADGHRKECEPKITDLLIFRENLEILTFSEI